MAVPALLYLGITWGTPMTSGWGIPMATDIAFALGLLALLGRRVPVSLKVFLTALAIVDDLGAILVIAIFYGHGFDTYFAVLALLTFATLVGINLVGVYSAVPYAVLGIILWVYVYASGLHATLAGILLAMTIPTRPPPNLEGLLAQAKAITEPWVAGSGSDDKKYPERGMVRAWTLCMNASRRQPIASSACLSPGPVSSYCPYLPCPMPGWHWLARVTPDSLP